MKSMRLVSNLWLAASSARARITTSSLISASPTAMAMALGANGNNDAVGAIINDTTANNDAIRQLAGYHPVIIEGMGYYDPRDPSIVAKNVYKNLQSHFATKSKSSTSTDNNKPLLVIVQGDPLSERGISAITPLVAEYLTGKNRGLVCLDHDIDPSHSQNADRDNVVLELKYSQLVEVLLSRNDNGNDNDHNMMIAMEESIDTLISKKNKERHLLDKPPMKDYFKQYALLQEVTKASIRKLCGNEITIAHTSADINPFSVTSFYQIGLELGLIDEATDMVPYINHDNDSVHGNNEVLDFDAIDKR